MGRWGMALSPFSIGSGRFRPVGLPFLRPIAAATRVATCHGHLPPPFSGQISRHALHSSAGIRSFFCQPGAWDGDAAVRSFLRSKWSVPHRLDETQQLSIN
jgi:hypothetical protein